VISLNSCRSDDRSLTFKMKIVGGLTSLTGLMLLFMSSGTSSSSSKILYVVIGFSCQQSSAFGCFRVVIWLMAIPASLITYDQSPLIILTVFWLFGGVLCELIGAFITLLIASHSSLFICWITLNCCTQLLYDLILLFSKVY